jgi:hypothetical protein
MTTFLFVLGLVIIFAVSRYNESNKLFWSLLVCYLLAFTASTLYNSYGDEKEGSNVELTQAYPTQGLPIMSETAFLVAGSDLATTGDMSPKPVSQVITPELCEFNTTSSVCGVTHEQNFYIFPNPPNKVEIVDDS